MSEGDLGAIWITALLALVTSFLLAIFAVPLAWWLARTQSKLRPVVEAIVAVPLVLPPTVMGFYFLVLLNPNAVFGSLILRLTGTQLTFSFAGLVIASMIYSLPFMVQPLQVAFYAIRNETLEASASLGLNWWWRFVLVVVPSARRGLLAAFILTFAHTVGEFGVVLMVGGNIPGETRVVSIAIYEHVETLAYGDAHLLAALLLGFAFITLVAVYSLNGGQLWQRRVHAQA